MAVGDWAEQLLLYANPHRSQPPFYPRWGVDPDELSEDEWDEYDDDDESEYEDESVCKALVNPRLSAHAAALEGGAVSLSGLEGKRKWCLKFILPQIS